MQIGTRVELVQDVDNYPHVYCKAGLTGTLARIDGEGSYWVRMDQYFPSLKEWDNELQIWNWSAENPGIACHPEQILKTII
jgi:hypothetical protein